LGIFNKYYSRDSIWYLFSSCAFPIHVWTFILFFRDFSWISERTNTWDAFGVGSYGLVIAFIESVGVTFIAAILGLLISPKWSKNRRLALLGYLVFSTVCWAVLGQLYYLLDVNVPPSLGPLIRGSSHPLWIIAGFTLIVIVISVVFPSLLILMKTNVADLVYRTIASFTTLTALYLFLDFLGLIVILIRNI
jgi:hypothetical protein